MSPFAVSYTHLEGYKRQRESRWRYASGVMPSASAAARLSILNMVPSTNALRPSTSRHCLSLIHI